MAKKRLKFSIILYICKFLRQINNFMKKFRFLAVLSVTTLLLGMTSCKKESSINIQELEQSLVGLWWDEYEYSDVTEDGVPFSRVLLAVRADADHTGCIYLGVFDDNSDKPLVVYGGPVDAGFTWKLLSDGSLVLSDPTSGESLLMTRADGENYGDTITDVSGTSMIYTADGLTMNNVSYSGTLTKADVDEQTDIMGKVAGEVGQLSTATASDYGKVVCDKGHLHPAKTAVPDGCTAVGILGKVSWTGHGLILALEETEEWPGTTIFSWSWPIENYAGVVLKVVPDKARGPLTNYTKLGETPVSNWGVAMKDVYEAIFTNLGSTTEDRNGKLYDSNVNAYLTTGVGGKELTGTYWSIYKSTNYSSWVFSDKSWDVSDIRRWFKVRPVLGFDGEAAPLSAATTSDVGRVVCTAGHMHDAKTAVPAGCTAVGILGKVTETGHGLILALQDATAQTGNTINGWTSVTTYAGTTLKQLPDDAARGANLTSYTTLGETAVSNWAVAQKSDYEVIFTNLGSTTGNSEGTTYDDKVNAYITTGVGGAAISGSCWSATEYDGGNVWAFNHIWWGYSKKTESLSVRPVLGF